MSTKKQLLREPEVEPSEKVLEHALGTEVFGVFKELMHTITAEFGLSPEWRFYKDAKAWLCKIVYKKKTVFWLSIWENLFKTSFYFTEKTRSGISKLRVSEEIKGYVIKAKPVGKLIPLVVDLENMDQLDDLKELIKFKIDLK